MRKKNLFKKLIAAAGAMAMALTLMVPMGVSEAHTMDEQTPVNLIIEKHKTPTPSGSNNPESTGEKLDGVSGDALPGVEFTIVKVADIGNDSYEVKYNLTEDGGRIFTSLKKNEGDVVTGSALQECLKPTSGNDLSSIKDCTNAISGKTATNGQVVFSSNNALPSGCEASTLVHMTTGRGIYLVVETAWPATVTTRSVPFLVSLPMTSKANNGNWIYDVYAYPKNSTEDFDIDKNITSVGDSGGNISSDDSKAEASIGDVITYQVPVTAVIPDGGLTKLGIKDTMSEGLTLIDDSNVEVNVTESGEKVTGVVDVHEGTTTGGNKLIEDTDYTVMASKGTNGNTILRVELSPSKIAALNKNAGTDNTPQFLFVYKAKLNKNAVAGSETTGNSVKLVYNYTNNPGAEIEFGKDIDTTIYTWGIDITKKSDTNQTLSGVTFELYKDRAEGTALKFKRINSGGNEDVYCLDTAGDSTLTTSADGKLVIHGLASGTYYLKETKTNSGYVLLKDPVKIVISPDSEFDGETTAKIGNNESSVKQNEDDRFEVTVVNNKGFDLPQTGAAGTALFAVAGMAIAAVAGGLLFFLRRSSKK
ncbi:MAG TPA: SpaH/EbpB family LPXTG-anchored major pilin [Candidatus Mediterraneibacter intestinigallinarum]|nr:SpaH/EbpB family LPXTG-anchored major pilin [Candidatus Mediterraneibacter intestinigallinarum]